MNKSGFKLSTFLIDHAYFAHSICFNRRKVLEVEVNPLVRIIFSKFTVYDFVLFYTNT